MEKLTALVKATAGPAKGGKWLVTGAGFMGSRIVHALRARGETDVTVCDVAPRRPSLFVDSGVRYLRCDITSRDGAAALADAVQGATAVVHTAARVSAQSSRRDSLACDAVNVQGTRHVIDACLGAGSVRSLVYLSTIEVIHSRGRPALGLTEAEPYTVRPFTNYARSKALAEKSVLRANRANGVLRTGALRPNMIAGERDLAFVSSLVAGGMPPFGLAIYPLRRSGAVKDINLAENVTHATLLLADALMGGDDPSPAEGQAFNLADSPQSLPKAYSHAAKHLGVRRLPLPYPLVYAVATAADGIRNTVYPKLYPFLSRASVETYAETVTVDGSKAERILGAKPIITMDEALDLYKQLHEEAKKFKAK